jgi:hypothetical protein
MAKALEIVYPPNSSSTFSKTSSTFPSGNYLRFVFAKKIFAFAILKIAFTILRWQEKGKVTGLLQPAINCKSDS